MARFKELGFNDVRWDEDKNISGKFGYSYDFADWTYVSIRQETAGSNDLWTVYVSGAFLGDENGDIAVFASPEDAFDAFMDACILFHNKEVELWDLFSEQHNENHKDYYITEVLRIFYNYRENFYREQEEAEKKRREQLEEERRLEDEKWRRKLRQEEYNKKYNGYGR